MDTFGAPSRDRYIRGCALWGFADAVRRAGRDPVALAERVGLHKTDLHDFDRLVSWRRLGMLVELAAEELNRPSFGIEWALTIPTHFPNVGPTPLLGFLVETNEEWLRLGFKYWRFHTNAYAMQLLMEPGNRAIMRFHIEPPAFAPRQVMEMHVANMTRMARHLTGLEDIDPLLVCFQHPRPADTAPHEALFRGPLEFGAPHYEIHFDSAHLARPTKGNLKFLKSLVSWYIRYRIHHLPIYDQTMQATVALAIQSVIGSGSCTLEFIAHSLGLSPKKLQRLLNFEGTSFSKILEDVRRAHACDMLMSSDAPIEHIARLLDYSTTAPFTLAFRRWTGMSPRAFRNRATDGRDGSA